MRIKDIKNQFRYIDRLTRNAKNKLAMGFTYSVFYCDRLNKPLKGNDVKFIKN